jgi:methylmalonyl-CoA mutase N-terminal domain/subunit
VIVGVNRFADGSEAPVVPTPDYSALEREQVQRLADVKSTRNARVAQDALAALGAAAAGYSRANTSKGSRPHLMPLIIDAVRARTSVGEISDVLRGSWGEFRTK